MQSEERLKMAPNDWVGGLLGENDYRKKKKKRKKENITRTIWFLFIISLRMVSLCFRFFPTLIWFHSAWMHKNGISNTDYSSCTVSQQTRGDEHLYRRNTRHEFQLDIRCPTFVPFTYTKHYLDYLSEDDGIYLECMKYRWDWRLTCVPLILCWNSMWWRSNIR